MIGHISPISGIAVSSSGLIATAGYDNRVIIWDKTSGAALARGNHDHLANQCAFSPDGARLASAGSDRTARIWRLPDLSLDHVLTGHDDDVEMVAFSPSGNMLATASRDRKVRLFDRSGRLTRVLVGHESDALSVQWLDEDRLVSSGDDGTARTWCARSGEQMDVLDLGDVEADTVIAGAEGCFYVGTDDGVVVMVRNGKTRSIPAHRSGVKRLAISPDRKCIASSSYDGHLAIWDLGDDGVPVERFRVGVPELVWPRTLCFAGPGRIVFGTFGSRYAEFDVDRRTWLLDGVTVTHGINAVCHHAGEIWGVGDSGRVVGATGRIGAELGACTNFLHRFGAIMLGGGHSGRVQNAMTGHVYFRHDKPLNCCADAVDGLGRPEAFIGTYAGDVLRVGVDVNGLPALLGKTGIHANAVKGLCVSAGRLFSVSASGAVAMHRAGDLSLVRHVEGAHDKIANGCDALPDGSFVSVSRDRTMRLWSPDAELLDIVATPHSHSIKCVASLAGGRMVATGAYDGRLAIYDRSSRTWPFDRRVTTSGISSLHATRNGIAIGSYDGGIRFISP